MNATLIDVDLSRPWAPIRSPLDMEVVLVLRGTTRPLTGRDVARLVRRGSQPAVNAALRRLADEGIVRAEEAGNAYLYTLNREHLAAPALEMLAGVRAELERRLRAEIEAWKIAPAHISIFGSAARGDGDTASDIDLFVVRLAGISDNDPRWRAQLDGLSEVSEKDLRRLRREHPPVIDELRRDAITLAGRTPAELLGSGR
jgi:predicted nucleotidyltransferase